MNIAGMVGPVLTGMLVQSAGTMYRLGLVIRFINGCSVIAIKIGFAIFARPEKKIEMKDNTVTVA